MVAARPTLHMLRSRSRAAGPWRLLGLVTLLYALVYTHGVSAEGAAGHAHPGASALATVHAHEPAHEPARTEHSHHGSSSHDDGRPGGHHEEPVPDHAAHQCVSAQPQQGVELPAPCEAPLQAVRPPHAVRLITAPAATPRAPASVLDSTVLRI
ncbi:DUF6153 family protein [Streptomyces sp. NPDC007808]|uniref:DUF6153 family protein n=1 Tax=Streptomyces sp. NPDC007808 TaxID=3364779 RepID=UPI0036C60C53